MAWHFLSICSFCLLCAAFDSYRSCPQHPILPGNSLGWLPLMDPGCAVTSILCARTSCPQSLEGCISSAWSISLLFFLAVYSKAYLLHLLSIWLLHSFSCHWRGKQYPKILCLTIVFVCKNLRHLIEINYVISAIGKRCLCSNSLYIF